MARFESDARRSVLLGVGVTSAGLVATEITLTRVLSVTIWYHFAFFAISVALLGTGVGALLVHATQRRFDHLATGALCGVTALLQAVATLAVGVALIGVTPDWFGGMVGAFTFFTWKLGLVFALTVLPFTLGGIVLAVSASRCRSQVHRMYFADLIGAAAGCLLVIPLQSWLGGARALAATAALSALSAAAFALDLTAARARAWLFGAACAVTAVAALCGSGDALQVRSAKGIDLQAVKPSFLGWNSFSMVTVFDAPPAHGWGLSPRYKGPLPEQKSIIIDMSALTPVAKLDGDLQQVQYALHDLSALVYRVVRQPREVCVVGAGGGKDVLAALAAGSGRVTGVEINPLIVEDVMRGALRKYSGGLYDRDDVRIVNGDGRAFLRGTDSRFDVILISMVDTSAATAAGAYALTENGLYTQQAFEEFLARLRPDGVLTVSTVSLPGLSVGARLVSLARQAVLALGGDPSQSIAVAHTPWMARNDSELYDILVKPAGFTDAELDAYQAALIDLGFESGYVPRRTQVVPKGEDGLIARIVTARDDAALQSLLDAQALDVGVVTDDRPFFFYQNRFRDFVSALGPGDTSHLFGNGLRILAKVLVIAAVMLMVTLVLPLLWARGVLGATAGLGVDLAYVGCLGVGFMCIEIALVHRVTLYLGQPTHTLVAVLFVLLLAGGAGSRVLGARVASRPSLGLWVFAAVAFGAAGLAPVLDYAFAHTAPWTLGARSLTVAVLLAPLGFALGALLPAGLSVVARRHADRVAWLWGVNGAASVLGSIVATLVSLHAGTTAALLLGCVLYLCASRVWWVMTRAATVRA